MDEPDAVAAAPEPEPEPTPRRKLFVLGFQIHPMLYSGDLEDGSLNTVTVNEGKPYIVGVNDIEQWATMRWPQDRALIEAKLTLDDARNALAEAEALAEQPPAGDSDPVA